MKTMKIHQRKQKQQGFNYVQNLERKIFKWLKENDVNFYNSLDRKFILNSGDVDVIYYTYYNCTHPHKDFYNLLTEYSESYRSYIKVRRLYLIEQIKAGHENNTDNKGKIGELVRLDKINQELVEYHNTTYQTFYIV